MGLVLVLVAGVSLALERRLHLRPVGIDHRLARRERNARIYRQWDAGATQAALADMYGLSRSWINQIVRRGIRNDPEAWEQEQARHDGDGRIPRAKLG